MGSSPRRLPLGTRRGAVDYPDQWRPAAVAPGGANHLTSVTGALGGVTAYAYDPTGNLSTRTDAKNHATGYAYDVAGRLAATTDPAGRAATLTYDPAGNVATRTDANARTTTFAYDALNRLTGISYAATTTPPVSYAYDANGNRTSMTDGAGTESFVYDSLNRLTSDTRGADTFAYTFDPTGNLLTRRYPDGTVTTYTYDDDGRPVSAASGGLTTTYTYDPAGNLLTTATPDGFTARSTFDRAGRLLEVANTSAAGTLSRFTYTLDPVGNRTAMVTTRETQLYAYDALNRLLQVCYGTCPGGGGPQSPLTNAPPVTTACFACVGTAAAIDRPPVQNPPPPSDTFTNFSYDPVGNRLTQTNYLGTTASTYDAADRLTSATPPGSATITYTYDANGNELAAGAATYAYNLADRLVSARVGTTTETYTWSGDGIRLTAATGSQANKTTQFVVDRAFPLPTTVLERSGSGSLLRRYLYGTDLLSQTTPTKGPYWYHHDGLGSVTDITGASGTPLWWAEYQPYGLVRASGSSSQAPVNPFGFSGQYLDSTSGLYYLRARQYDPSSGRFTAVDPIGPSVGETAIGAYVYANNNPVRYTDPSGRDTDGVCLTAEVFVGVAFIQVAICPVVSVESGQIARRRRSAVVIFPQRSPRRRRLVWWW